MEIQYLKLVLMPGAGCQDAACLNSKIESRVLNICSVFVDVSAFSLDLLA